MILIEPSAILAVLKEEDDAPRYRERIASARNKVVLVVGKVEAAISLGRAIRDHDLGGQLVNEFCTRADIDVVGVGPDIYGEAVTAYRRYGKGTGHRAGLNFGDCFSYAYAKKNAVPLLYKGDDFAQTDVESAL